MKKLLLGAVLLPALTACSSSLFYPYIDPAKDYYIGKEYYSTGSYYSLGEEIFGVQVKKYSKNSLLGVYGAEDVTEKHKSIPYKIVDAKGLADQRYYLIATREDDPDNFYGLRIGSEQIKKKEFPYDFIDDATRKKNKAQAIKTKEIAAKEKEERIAQERDYQEAEAAAQKRAQEINYDGYAIRGRGYEKGKLYKFIFWGDIEDVLPDGVMVDAIGRMMIYTKENYIDGQMFETGDYLYECVGTYKYITVIGSTKTIPAFKRSKYKTSEIDEKTYLKK